MTRKDLKPGSQIAQSCHAFREFVAEHKEIESSWYESSNYLVVLSVEDEKALEQLLEKVSSRRIRFSLFREPDMNDELTAIALEPGKAAQKVCSNIGLALK